MPKVHDDRAEARVLEPSVEESIDRCAQGETHVSLKHQDVNPLVVSDQYPTAHDQLSICTIRQVMSSGLPPT